jgi:acyl carrier protein
MSTRAKTQKIVEEVLADPTVTFSDELSMSNCAAWDSVATVQIVLAVEQEFDVRFTTAEVAELRSIRGLLELLARYGHADKPAS